MKKVREDVLFNDATVFKTIRYAYDSMPHRIQIVLEKNGAIADIGCLGKVLYFITLKNMIIYSALKKISGAVILLGTIFE